MRYRVYYQNEGRAEHTRLFESTEEARKSADFLRIQGATGVSIRPEFRLPPLRTGRTAEKIRPWKP